MAFYTTVEDWQDVDGNYVVDVTIRRTEDEAYPSGWDSGLHLGAFGGDTLLRHDNAHERTNGHERHPPEGGDTIGFEGGGPGRAKKPVLPYDGLEIDIPFTDPAESVDTDTAAP